MEPPALDDAARRRRSVAAGVLALLLVVMAVLLLGAPLLPEPRSLTQFRTWAYGSHIVFFGVVSAAVAVSVPVAALPRRWLLTAVGATFVGAVALNVLEVPVASDVVKFLFGAFAGAGLVRMIERPWWLVPICLCVPIADAWSVFSSKGVTNAVVERAQEDRAWIDWPTIATPIAGFPYESFGRIGIVDVLFIAVFLGAAARWRLGLWRCVAFLTAGFVGTSVLVFEDVATAVPALPLLCVAFLLGAGPGLWRDMRAAARGD